MVVGELTHQEAAILDRYFNYGLVQIQRLHEMNELGLAHEGWEDRINYLGWHLGNEVGRRWWSYSKSGFPEDFRIRVDEILARRDHKNNRDLLNALMPKSDSGID